MATSGTSSFNATRNEIIRAAARKVGALRPGASLGDGVIKDWEFQLNAMVKLWQAAGLHVWTVTEATLFPAVDKVTYRAGAGATDHITESYDTTTTTADASGGEVTFSVDDTDDMTVDDHIAITLDDGTLHWSTIDSKTATTVTIDDATTDSVEEGNKIFFYTSRIVRPIKVVDARRYDIASGQETPIRMESRRDYQALTNKTENGTITIANYDPQLSTGLFHLWQVPVTIEALVKFTWWRPIQDFSIAADNPDLPQEWINTLVFNLSLQMCPDYGVKGERYALIKEQAAITLDMVQGFDREEEPVFFAPDMDGSG